MADQLAAHHLRDERGQVFQVARAAAAFAYAGGDGRSCHRRLLGGDGEMQDMDEHETEAVIEGDGDAFDQRRHRLCTMKILIMAMNGMMKPAPIAERIMAKYSERLLVM